MRFEKGDVRFTVGVALSFLTIVVAVYLWFLDLLTMQGVFGALLATELVAFAMIIHVYRNSSFSRAWLLLGCTALALLLTLALTGGRW